MEPNEPEPYELAEQLKAWAVEEGFTRAGVARLEPSANGDFYVPLATTEGALVASCQRGSQVISRSGGAAACCFTESVSRAPCFAFESLVDAGQFLAWVIPQYDQLQAIVSGTSSMSAPMNDPAAPPMRMALSSPSTPPASSMTSRSVAP